MSQAFTPALGREALTPLYDLVIRLLTRERYWRSLLLEQVAPHDGENILDLGCGTGTFAIMLKLRSPGVRILGIDPDLGILQIARKKARRAGVEIEWRQGVASDLAGSPGTFDKAVSSLVFHQVTQREKEAGIAAMVASVPSGGEVHIADYAQQRGYMRQLFRIVQRLDGYENTQANADGALERIFARYDGPTRAAAVVATPTGAISLFRMLVDHPSERQVP